MTAALSERFVLRKAIQREDSGPRGRRPLLGGSIVTFVTLGYLK